MAPMTAAKQRKVKLIVYAGICAMGLMGYGERLTLPSSRSPPFEDRPHERDAQKSKLGWTHFASFPAKRPPTRETSTSRVLCARHHLARDVA